jgi:hypothetical protein
MSSTKILLKRTQELLKKPADDATKKDIQTQPIDFGEPLFIDNNSNWGNVEQKCNSYIALGSPVNNGSVSQAALFKGFWDINKANSLVFYKPNREGLETEEGEDVFADKLIVGDVDTESTDDETKYYILCQPNVGTNNTDYRTVKKFQMRNNKEDVGIYVSSRGIMHGAAWNDYAEKRKVLGLTNPGDVVCENGDGTLSLSEERLQACPYVVSDTYGFVIGDDKDIPLAVAGRALVKVTDEHVAVGDCLCAGEDGKAYVMSRPEVMAYPDRILGIVTEIPNYDEWNGVKINNRVWIKIK